MGLRTPITYYGGKQQLAGDIIAMMPPHRIYAEPYFGGGAVFFAKGRSPVEVINDIDGRLITFYEVCQSEELFPLLYDKIRHTLHSEAYHMKAYEIWKRPVKDSGRQKVDLAWAVWLTTNMSFSGSPGSGWKWDNGTSGGHSGITMEHYRQDFGSALHDRLKLVQISCRDALTVIRQRDSQDTFFFLDPPYPGCVQKHYRGFGWEELEELLVLLSGIRGKFILCNFWSDLLGKYTEENGWNTRVFDLPMRVANFGGNVRRKRECMVYNYVVEPTLF